MQAIVYESHQGRGNIFRGTTHCTQNLKATPTVQVQVMDRILQVHAGELSAEETIAFWPRVLRVAPTYARYQKATSRTIPLVRLVPVAQAGEQAMPGGEVLHGQKELFFTK